MFFVGKVGICVYIGGYFGVEVGNVYFCVYFGGLCRIYTKVRKQEKNGENKSI